MSVQNFVSGQGELGRPSSEQGKTTRHHFHSWISLAAVAVLAAASAVWIAVDRAEASRAPIVSSQVALSEQSSNATSLVKGTIKQVLVKPGDAVKAGQLIAVVDAPDLTTAVHNAQQAVTDAQKKDQATQAAVLPPSLIGTPPPFTPPIETVPSLPVPRGAFARVKTPTAIRVPIPDPAASAAKEKAASLVRQLEAIVQQASDKVKAAKTDLAASSQEAEGMKAPLENLQTSLDSAQSQRDKYKSLYSDGIISRVEFQQKQTDVDNAQAALDQAQKQVTDAEADVKTRETDVASNQKLLDTLSGRLLEAQKQLASIHVPPAPLVASRPVPMPLLAPPTGVPMMRAPRPLGAPPGLAPVGVAFSPIAHAEAQAHLDALEKQLAAAEEALKRTEIRAATDGIVSTIVLEAGQPVTDGATVATISRPETESVVISVPHTDAQRIKPGQACQIQLTGNSQERFAGVVSGFQSQGSAAAGAQVQVKLQGDPNALFQLPPNTQLQATIDTSGG